MSKYSFNIEELDGAVKISDSFADVARKLGYNEKNKYHINKIQLEIKKYNISTSHFYSIKKLRKWDKITKELLIDLVKNNESIKDILNNLDLSLSTKNYKKLKQYLSDFNIDYNFKFSVRENGNNIYTEDKLKSIAKISYTYKDMCKNLGLSTTGNNNDTVNTVPFGPTTPTIPAGGREKLRSSINRRSPNDFLRFATSMTTSPRRGPGGM
jgi:hypothetical protein